MSSKELVEVFVALHVNPPKAQAVLVSDDGENAHAKWIPRKFIGSLHETGKTTVGTDRNGARVILPMAHLTIPEWLAKREGLI